VNKSAVLSTAEILLGHHVMVEYMFALVCVSMGRVAVGWEVSVCVVAAGSHIVHEASNIDRKEERVVGWLERTRSRCDGNCSS